jgi:hypothetical protein
MPDASSAETILTVPEKSDFSSRGDVCFVRERLMSIAALADRGSHADARGACADLLFDSQPLVVAHTDLATLCDDVLLRCGATALRFRFRLAAYGEAPGGDTARRRASVTPNRLAHGTPQPLAAMVKQTV